MYSITHVSPFIYPTSYVAEMTELREKIVTLRSDLDSSETKKSAQAKALEKTNRVLKQEKTDLHRVS